MIELFVYPAIIFIYRPIEDLGTYIFQGVWCIISRGVFQEFFGKLVQI
jgi:hypothetical protein